MYTHRLLKLLTIATLLVITACAPQVEPASTAAPTDTATVAPTAAQTPTIEPTATVQPTRTATNIPVYLPFQPGKYLHPNDPTSYFIFKENGRWENYLGDSLANSGTYRVEGNTYFQLTNSHGCPSASFKFSFDGTYLKFQLTDESRNDTSCPERTGFYDNTTYIFSP